MFSLKSALTWGIGLALGLGLVASLHPGIRAYLSQVLEKTQARVESTLGFAEEGSASMSTGSPAHTETGTETGTPLQTRVQVQTGAGVNVSAGNTSAMVGTEAGVNAESQNGWSLKSLFYKLTHGSFGLSAQGKSEADTEANP